MKRSAQIAAFTVSFLFGIVIGVNFSPIISLWYVALSAVVLVVCCFWAKKLIVFALIPVAIVLGINYLAWWSNYQKTNSVEAFIGQKVQLTGRVQGTSYWNDYGQYVATLGSLQLNGRAVHGTVRVSSLLSNAQEGFAIAAEGKLYQTRSRADAQLMYAKTRVISTKVPRLVSFKNAFERGIDSALPSPMSQFEQGIIIGDRSALPKVIQDDLTRVGLSHIIAVSGYNLTILIMIVASLLRSKWKWLNLVIALWLIVGFVLLTGAAASIMRAGIMSGLFLICRFYGKKLSIISALLLTALATVLLNPLYLISDLGWQLSFASLAGIVLFVPLILKLAPKKLPKLTEIIAVTLAAQIFTLPLIAYKFGTLSLVAPLANLAIMPLVPLLMSVGIIAGLAGIVAPALSGYAFLPLGLGLRKLLELIHMLAGKTYASINIVTPTVGQVLLYYLIVMGGVMAGLRSRAAMLYNRAKEQI